MSQHLELFIQDKVWLLSKVVFEMIAGGWQEGGDGSF